MTKISGFGATLEWDPAGGTAWATIGQVANINAPTLSRNSIDVTTHDSTDWWMEFIKGLKDSGEISFDIVYDPALSTHDFSTGLLSDFDEDSVIPNWRLTFPDTGATQWTFKAFLTSMPVTVPIDDKLGASVTVKLAGKPTLA